MMKRHTGIVLLLAALIAVGIMTATCVSAHTFADMEDYSAYNDAVELLNAIGVVRGTSETTFEPGNRVQRWQMALMLTKLITGNVNDSDWFTLPEGTKFSFSDINSSQYMNAIRYADEHGIIIGDGKGHFDPTGGITLQDAVTMTVRALGYPRAVYDANYPHSYLQLGVSLGLLDGLDDTESTAPLTRAQTAQLLVNAFTAKRYTGYTGTLAESVFRYVDRTLVLTATSDLRINPNLPYQSEGTLAFNELKADGTFGTAHIVKTENLLSFSDAQGLLTDPDACIGASYHVISTGDMTSVISFEAKNKGTPETVTVASDSSVTIGGHPYRTVSAYSYSLTDNAAPASHEIIVYGFGEMYATGAVISAKEMAAYTDYCTMTAYDDNGDGYWDRALFFPYSYGQLRINGDTVTVNKPDGKKITFDRTKAQLSGISPTDGANVLYSYIPLSTGHAIFRIRAVATVVSGVITDYDLSSGVPSITFRTASDTAALHCTLGARINGAQSASLVKLLRSDTDDRYIGCTAAFALIDHTVIALSFDESALYGRLNEAALGKTPYAVIRSVNGKHAELSFGTSDRHTVTIHTIGGFDPLSSSAPALSEYDLVSYTVMADGTYALTPVRLPVFTADDDLCRLHAETDETGKMKLVISHISEDGSQSVLATFPIADTAHILKYTEINGAVWLGAYLEIPCGYELYLTTGASSSNTVTFAYIKPAKGSADTPSTPDTPLVDPKEIVTSAVSDTAFTTVVYLDGTFEKASDSLYIYRGYNLADITESNAEVIDIYASCELPTAGYYKCRTTQNGIPYVSDLHRITSTVHNAAQTLYFIPNTTLQVLSDAYFRIGSDIPVMYRGAVHAAITFGSSFVPSREYLTGPSHVLISYSAFSQVASLCQIMIGN